MNNNTKEDKLLLGLESLYRKTVKAYNAGNQDTAINLSRVLKSEIDELIVSNQLSVFGGELLLAIHERVFVITKKSTILVQHEVAA